MIQNNEKHDNYFCLKNILSTGKRLSVCFFFPRLNRQPLDDSECFCKGESVFFSIVEGTGSKKKSQPSLKNHILPPRKNVGLGNYFTRLAPTSYVYIDGVITPIGRVITLVKLKYLRSFPGAP